MVIHRQTDLFGKFPGDFLPGRFKPSVDVFYPMGSAYFIKIDGISKFIERKALLFKQLVHQVLFASEQAIRHGLLQLPNTPELFLEIFGVLELTDLLEFINTDHHTAPFLLGYLFRQLEDFCHVLTLGIQFQGDGKFRSRVPNEILGLILERNSFAFSTHSSHLEEVCLITAEAKAS